MPSQDEIERFLADFDEDPATVMDRVPEKRASNGAPLSRAATAFDAGAVDSGDYVTMRDEVRSRLQGKDARGRVYTVADLAAGKAPIARNDRAEDLVDKFDLDKLDEMEAATLTRAALPESPWSDDYWAIYLGVLGHRYADPNFPNADDWKDNFDYVTASPAAKLIKEGAIDMLSPSEKYDLLVGDAAGTLTREMWADGKERYESTGSVETWMGICHGWAPAAYNVRRPRKVVTVKGAGGELIRFFPADIKALASLLWANGNPASKIIGSRCNEKDPPKDEVGRVQSSSAFDTNPGTFHLAMVNQIGVGRRALVMDATYDYEVWNQPVCGYEYHYFNPQTMSFAANFEEAVIDRADFTRDRFTKYRSEDYERIVGVAMRARYVAEYDPVHRDTDDQSRDVIVNVDYYYDLELDGDAKILGGEWYLNKHPDFLWNPPRGTRVVTPADAFAEGAWAAGQPVPASFRTAAVRGSATALPLAKIVERLVELANG